MGDPRFIQSGFEKELAHLVEECGEVLAAAGKLQRWGPHSVNPLLPPHEQETNIAWLWREIGDLESVIARIAQTIRKDFPELPNDPRHPSGPTAGEMA